MLSEAEHKRIQIRDLARELSEILSRIDQLHEQQSQVLVGLDEAAMAADYSALTQYRHRDGRLLSRIVDEERQRLIISEELGDVIGLDIPAKLALDDVVELGTQPTGVGDPAGPRDGQAVAGAAEVGSHLLHPLEGSVQGPRPAHVVVALAADRSEVVDVLEEELRILLGTVLERRQ